MSCTQQLSGAVQQSKMLWEVADSPCADSVRCYAAGHEEEERLERLIVKDFRNELKGHKERLQQSHRVRVMLDTMQERAKKLVSLNVWCLIFWDIVNAMLAK